MDVRNGKRGARVRGWSFGVLALAVALAGLDLVVLRGERVAYERVALDSAEPAVLQIDRVGEPHLVEITTRRRRSGETKGRSVDYRLEDPDGRIVAEKSELVSHKRRYVRFEPEVAGAYRVFVEDEGLFGARRGRARVAVYVNDRRIFGPRLFAFLSF